MKALLAAVSAILISTSSTASTVMEFAISPEAKSRPYVWPAISSAIMAGKAGDVITVVDTSTGLRVGTIKITSEVAEAPNATSKSKWISQQSGESVKQVKQFLTSPGSAKPTDFPRYIKSLDVRKTEFSGNSIAVVYMGSPLHTQPEQFSMVNRYLSDSFITTADTPYSTTGNKSSIANIAIHVIHSPDAGEFSSKNKELHYANVKRFIGKFISQMGGNLATFTGDTAHLQSIMTTQFPKIEYGPLEIRDNKLRIFEVLEPRLEREDATRQSSLWSEPVTSTPIASTLRLGKMDVGISWDTPCDMDLYVKAEGDKELFFASPSSEKYTGRFLKDIQSLPENKGFETVTFGQEIPIRSTAIYINHYSGRTSRPTNVELRIRINGNTFSKVYQIQPGQGTAGSGDRNTDKAWIKVNLSSIIG